MDTFDIFSKWLNIPEDSSMYNNLKYNFQEMQSSLGDLLGEPNKDSLYKDISTGDLCKFLDTIRQLDSEENVYLWEIVTTNEVIVTTKEYFNNFKEMETKDFLK